MQDRFLQLATYIMFFIFLHTVSRRHNQGVTLESLHVTLYDLKWYTVGTIREKEAELLLMMLSADDGATVLWLLIKIWVLLDGKQEFWSPSYLSKTILLLKTFWFGNFTETPKLPLLVKYHFFSLMILELLCINGHRPNLYRLTNLKYKFTNIDAPPNDSDSCNTRAAPAEGDKLLLYLWFQFSLRKELHFIQIRDRIKSVGKDDYYDDALLKPRLQRRRELSFTDWMMRKQSLILVIHSMMTYLDQKMQHMMQKYGREHVQFSESRGFQSYKKSKGNK